VMSLCKPAEPALAKSALTDPEHARALGNILAFFVFRCAACSHEHPLHLEILMLVVLERLVLQALP